MSAGGRWRRSTTLAASRAAAWSGQPSSGCSPDIAERKVDVVVVYKVDLLTRARADFAKIVEVFDAQGVSFVSVTQQFNATTSMGRLTLNVLLSFAQFAREVIAERVRDKVAASKAKGMWMGGHAPLGYDMKDRKLIVNGAESGIVRQIFRRYLDLGSVKSLAIELTADGTHSKARTSAKGRLSGSRPYGRGQHYNHLRCHLYRRIVHHRGRDHVGEHQAIVDPDLWQAVQARLAASRVQRITAAGGRSLLAGLLFDGRDGRLTPTHAVKQGKRYRYNVSDALLRGGAVKQTGWRLPAQTIEEAVVDAIGSFLRDEARLADAIGDRIRGAHAIRQIFAAARDLAAKLADDPHSVVEAIVRRVVLDDASVSIGPEQTSVMRALDVPSVENGDDVLALTQPRLGISSSIRLRLCAFCRPMIRSTKER